MADTGAAALRFESGPIGVMTAAWAGAAAPGFHLELAGQRGRLVIQAAMMPAAESTVRLGRAGAAMEDVSVPDRLTRAEGIDLPNAWPGDPRGAMARSFWLMTRAIAGDGQARPDFARAYQVQTVIESVYRSGQGGGWVRPSEL